MLSYSLPGHRDPVDQHSARPIEFRAAGGRDLIGAAAALRRHRPHRRVRHRRKARLAVSGARNPVPSSVEARRAGGHPARSFAVSLPHSPPTSRTGCCPRVRRARGSIPRWFHEHVDRPKLVVHLGDHRLDGFLIRDVGLHDHRPGARGLDQVGRFPGRLFRRAKVDRDPVRRSANRWQQARPMPRDPPVTKTVRFSKSGSLITSSPA